MASKDKGRTAIVKAGVLTIGLIFGLIAYSKISTTDMSAKLLTMFDETGSKYTNRIEFPETTKVELKKTFAGFWTFQSSPDANPRIDDRIELKDNGIVWQISRVDYTLPSGAVTSIMNIVFGYNDPFSLSDKDSSFTVCNYVKVRQIWIYDNDTCYGQSNEAGVWVVRMEDGSINRNGRNYDSFGNGDLSQFFPSNNLIPLVDKVDLPACPPQTNRLTFIRGKLNEDLTQWGAAKKDVAGILTILNEYYIPFCFTELPINEAAIIDRKFTDVKLDLTIAGNGVITKAVFNSPSIRNAQYLKMGATEVESWNMGPMGSNGMKLTYKNGVVIEPLIF